MVSSGDLLSQELMTGMNRIFIIILLTIWFYLLLLTPLPVNGQTKPRAADAVTPSENWANGLIRAYLLSDADSANGSSAGGVKDWSPIGSDGTATNAAAWTNDGGNETPLFSSQSAYYMNGGFGLDTLVTDHLTIAQRVKLTSNGFVNASISSYRSGVGPPSLFFLNQVGYSNTSVWTVTTSGTVTQNAANTYGANTFATYIMNYGGDSIRVWLDNVYKGAAAQTGNIPFTSDQLIIIGLTHDGVTPRFWAGSATMTCAWNRNLTSGERDQIWADPYVMFRTPSATQKSQVIMINSMLPELPKVALYLLLLEIISIIYRKFVNRQKKS